MQRGVAIRRNKPAVQCSARIDYKGTAPCLRIEICVTVGDIYTREVLVMYDIDEEYHAQERPFSFTDYNDNSTSVPEIRVKSAYNARRLGISRHDHGFCLRDSQYLGDIYYSADRIRTILQTLIAACTAYPSVVQSLQQAMDWV